jgi:hypothetical protein
MVTRKPEFPFSSCARHSMPRRTNIPYRRDRQNQRPRRVPAVLDYSGPLLHQRRHGFRTEPSAQSQWCACQSQRDSRPEFRSHLLSRSIRCRCRRIVEVNPGAEVSGVDSQLPGNNSLAFGPHRGCRLRPSTGNGERVPGFTDADRSWRRLQRRIGYDASTGEFELRNVPPGHMLFKPSPPLQLR